MRTHRDAGQTLALKAALILVPTLTSGTLAQSEQTMPLRAVEGPADGPAVHLVQDDWVTARELYAFANYQDALDMLDRLVAANPSPLDRQSIDLYRTFCFVALGRTSEADATIAAMLTRDPLYRPPDSEIPPRMRNMFSEKRTLVLPAVIQSWYKRAKDAFDQGNYKAAAEGFTETLMFLSDSEIAVKPLGLLFRIFACSPSALGIWQSKP